MTPSNKPAARTGPDADAGWPPLSVILVTYCSADFVRECLDSLVAAAYPALRIIVVDNNSDDGTPAVVEFWARNEPRVRFGEDRSPAGGEAPPPGRPPVRLELIKPGTNGGFASGVNIGLRAAKAEADCDLFWILNPDTTVAPDAPFELVRKAREVGDFSVIGGRILYSEHPDTVQTDGGRLHPLAGTAVNVNIGSPAAQARAPAAESLAYIPGVSMLASRAFLDRAGPMPEHWFLYFEEIDWQLERGDLPLALAPAARIYHRAGGSIGSGTVKRGASPLSVYFMCRNLLPFVRKRAPRKLPFAYAIAYYKLLRQWRPTTANIAAALRGLHGLPPPAAVRRKLPDTVWNNILADTGRRLAGPLGHGVGARSKDATGW